MYVEVEYVLACSFAVLLNYADAVGVGDFVDGCGNLFGYVVNMVQLFFRDIKYVNVMRLWNNQRMPLV